MSSSPPTSCHLLLVLLFTLASPGNIIPNVSSSTLNPISLISNVLPLSNNFYNFTELAGSYGYDVEEHCVTTDDGYILISFRMSNRTCPRDKGTPVILLHGFLESSDEFLDAGPGEGLAYQLADACRDVWAINNRGNYYGRAHTKLNPDSDPKFWEFSLDEMGSLDLPAHVDYILKHTNQKAVNFVSVSLGGGVFYSMAAAKPEICPKIKVHVGLAPVTRLKNLKSLPTRLLLRNFTILNSLVFPVTGKYEFLRRGSLTQQALQFACGLLSKGGVTHEACYSLFYIADSLHLGSITPNTTKLIFTHFPAGTSVRNVIKLSQSLETSNFQMYDFGSKEDNLREYGCDTPPIYDLTKVNVPSVLIHGANDNILSDKDLDWLIDQLPRVLKRKTVDDPLWNHFDNGYSSLSSCLIFPTIIEYLNKYC